MLELLCHSCSSLIIGALFLVIFLAWNFLTPRRPKTMPPGPKTKFIFGNMDLMKGSGTERITNLMNAVKTYGDNGLCTLYVGSKALVFITDYETIKKVVNDENFSGRPKSPFRDAIFHRKGLIFTDGDLWKEQRRFALSTLRDLGMGKNWLQDLIIEEAKAMVENIKTHEGQPIHPVPYLTTSVSNVICAIAYGKRFDHNDEKFRHLTGLIGQNVTLASTSQAAEFFPFLRFIPFTRINYVFGQFKKNCSEVSNFLGDLVTEHQKDFEPGENTDYIHAYMNEAHKQQNNPNSTFTAEQLQMSIFNLFGAGTETTSTTLAWAIVYLVNHPKVYEKVQEEVDAVLPDGGFANLEEKDSLPYLQATIMEVQRLANLVPLVPRRNLEADEINGYQIPPNTTIIPFLNAVHLDERYFPEPHAFKPERFLDASGKVKKIDAFIPFSIGKRYCIGESLAKMELYIFFTSLMKHFSISAAPGKKLSVSESVFGVVNAPKPFEVIFKSR